jgi:hypothetical protein
LFDLSVDRAETKNLAQQFPERVKELEAKWVDAAKQFKTDRRESELAK